MRPLAPFLMASAIAVAPAHAKESEIDQSFLSLLEIMIIDNNLDCEFAEYGHIVERKDSFLVLEVECIEAVKYVFSLHFNNLELALESVIDLLEKEI